MVEQSDTGIFLHFADCLESAYAVCDEIFDGQTNTVSAHMKTTGKSFVDQDLTISVPMPVDAGLLVDIDDL